MTSFFGEIRTALRGMVRDRVFALPVLLTLTLCIAANAAVFTVVHSVLLRPLPLPEPDGLVQLNNAYPGAGVAESDNGVPDYYDRRQAVTAFEELALYVTSGRTVGTVDGAERLTGMFATPSLFRLLRAQPLRGRILEERDGVPGNEQQVLLSYGLWQRLYAGADDAVGRELRINGQPHQVVGVMPRDFVFVDSAVTFWLPLAFTPEDRADDQRHSNSYAMVGRLRRGATLEQVRQQLAALNAANLDRFPEMKQIVLDAGFTTLATPLQERLVRDVRATLYLLWGGVSFVLLIGGVNVTNLALVRATGRSREVAARRTLGAGPWRLLRQQLVEGLLLTSLAGVLGTLIAAWAVRGLAAAAGERIPRGNEIALGPPTLLMVGGLAVVFGVLLALIPMAYSARGSLAQTLREEGRAGTASRSARSLRRSLVAAQVGFAFVLLLGAGLLLTSFRELLRVRPGFEPSGVLTGKVALPSATYPEDADLLAWSERSLERVRALPGVVAAGLATGAPLSGNYSDSVALPEGFVPVKGESVVSPSNSVVTPGYFPALRIAVRRGRDFDQRDTPTSQAVVIVDQALADLFWPGQDPIGRRMYQPDSPEDVGRPGPDTRFTTVVGVVDTVKQRGLAAGDERLGAYYYPLAQRPLRTLTLAARVQGDPTAVAATVRRELAALDPQMPFYDVMSMGERVAQSVAGRLLATRLASGFGLVALLLATFGIYGVLAYQVSQRRREIGIRMALGSEARQVFRLILAEGAALVAVGLAIGLGGLFALRRALAAQLYGVTPFEPVVLAAVTALLAFVALGACLGPARRAARVDPAAALSD
jgi:predicted permease